MARSDNRALRGRIARMFRGHSENGRILFLKRATSDTSLRNVINSFPLARGVSVARSSNERARVIRIYSPWRECVNLRMEERRRASIRGETEASVDE